MRWRPTHARVHGIAVLLGFAVGFAAWIGVFASQFGMPSLSSRWTWELLQKKQAIADRAQGPKLVVAGGSSALFGIRAEQLGRELGVPAYNMATYAALGLPYMLHRIEGMVRPGDTVILSLEYELYYHDPFPPQVDFLSAHDPAYFEQLPILKQLNGIFRIDLGRAISPWVADPSVASPRNPLSAYEAKDQLNAVGDALGNNAVLKNEGSRALVDSLPAIPVDVKPPNEREIEAFAAWAREHRIKVLATHPSLIDFGPSWKTPQLRRAMEAIDQLHSRIGMPFVDRWEDVLYPRPFFFDTIYHLDSVAASIRTRALMARVRSHIDRSKAWAPLSPADPPNNPLAELAQNFAGWEPLTGFGMVEGPYPQWNLGPVIWAWSPRSEFVVRSDVAGLARFSASLRGSHAGQRTELWAKGARLSAVEFEDDKDFRDWTAEVKLSAGENRFVLLHSNGGYLSSLIRRMRIDR